MSAIRLALVALLLATGSLPAAGPRFTIDSFRVTALLESLDDDNFEVRQQADEELRQMGKAVVAYLREEHLRTKSPEVKDRLGRMIRDLSVHERIPQLVEMLSHKDQRFRTHAHRTLRNVSLDQLPVLEAELVKRNGEGRQQLQQIIAELSTRK